MTIYDDPKVKLLTRDGYDRIAAELDRLWKHERPLTVARIADAAAEGDRSENAEYIYGKKKLREIDRQIHYFSKLLDGAVVVDIADLSGDRVGFGATVTLRDNHGHERTWTLVGEGESDGSQGTISYRSPVGLALLGKRVGDIVEVELPDDELIEFEIVALRYG